MHELILISILLTGQTDGPRFDAAPSPLGSFGTGRNATSEANVGQHVQQPSATANAHPQETYVAPASATEPETAPVKPLTPREPLPLARPGQASQLDDANARTPPTVGGSIVNIVSSLAVVLGLFFIVAWLLRRGAPRGTGALPSDVVQVIGRSQLSPKQQMQLLRVGEKLVLVAITATGVQTLTEVTDPDEVTRLLTACEAASGGSASDSFRQVLSQLGNQPAVGGFFGRSETASTSRSRRSSSGEEVGRA